MLNMIASERHLYILSTLRTSGTVRIADVAAHLGVSNMTIRRDIADLAAQGLLRRVRGGAVSTSSLLSEPLFSVKSQQDVDLKDSIAQQALSFVKRGDVVAIGGGTTAYIFARRLFESDLADGLTVLTNSAPVAELAQAQGSSGTEVIVTGGMVTRSNALVGPIANGVIGQLRVNSLFLGTHSVSIPRGFLTPNSLEASTNEALIAISDRTYILADHSKWQNTSLSLFATYDKVDAVITDAGIDDQIAAKTRQLVKELVIAPPVHQSTQKSTEVNNPAQKSA